MQLKKITLVSRISLLAMWQAEYVKAKLLALYPALEIEIKGIKTTGDKLLDVSLTKMGGKGLFVTELREALLNKTADIAVHSLKDMPAILEPQLKIAAVLEREDARDAFVSEHYSHVNDIPAYARVGTSSLRRQSQLLRLRADLNTLPLRGNVDTRLAKLKKGEFDAIILAAAGLKRLNLQAHVQHYFEPSEMLPAIGQGALAIECREDNTILQEYLKPLHHLSTYFCVTAERALSEVLGGSCELPLAGLASLETEEILMLQAKICSPDGKEMITAQHQGSIHDPILLGKTVAKSLLAQGAERIIQQCKF